MLRMGKWAFLPGVLSLAIAAVAYGQPTFTGEASTDFGGAGPQVVFAPDPTGDVGLPASCPEVTSTGWDIQGVWWYYDRFNDLLYVGIDSTGILGDVDGNGDPDTAIQCIKDQGGDDAPDFGGLEAFVVTFDLDRDGLFDYSAGVDINMTIGEFSVSKNDGSSQVIVTAVSSGDPRPGLVSIAPVDTDSSGINDIEFVIGPVSDMFHDADSGFDYPFDNDADPGAFIFNYRVFCGGILDDGIGEDFVTPTQIGFVCMGWDKDPVGSPLNGTPPGELITTQLLPIGVLVDGISHSGNPGAFAYDTAQDDTTDDQIPPGAPYNSAPNVLFTRRAQGTTDSDDGVITYTFINPFDGVTPISVSYADLLTIDVEDSADRGNATVTATYEDGSTSTINVPNSGNNGYYTAVFSGECGSEQGGIRELVADLGDSEDSAATDVLCYNLCPFVLPVDSGAEDATSDAGPGSEVTADLHVIKVNGDRQTVDFDGRAWIVGKEKRVKTVIKNKTVVIPAHLDKTYTVGFTLPPQIPPSVTDIIFETRIRGHEGFQNVISAVAVPVHIVP